MIPPPLELFPPLEPPSVGAPPWDPLPPLPPAVPPSACDIVIVGAGITGLSAAAACAVAGRHVVVLERAFGTGATARSGGVVLGETVEGPDPEFDGCEDVLHQWIQESGADCDLRWRGCLELARDARLSSTPDRLARSRSRSSRRTRRRWRPESREITDRAPRMRLERQARRSSMARRSPISNKTAAVCMCRRNTDR